MKNVITEIQITLTLREKKAIRHCIRMAESHIADWAFHDNQEKESVRVAKQFIRKLKLLGSKVLEEEKCQKKKYAQKL